MHPARSHRFALIWLMAAAFLLTRIGGVHLHLCFDGDEPPASIHLEDAGVHHGAIGMSGAHHDLDIAATGDLPSKFKLDLPSLLFAYLLLWLSLPLVRSLAVGKTFAAVQPTLHFLRPPLRGPPIAISL